MLKWPVWMSFVRHVAVLTGAFGVDMQPAALMMPGIRAGDLWMSMSVDLKRSRASSGSKVILGPNHHTSGVILCRALGFRMSRA